MDTAAKAVLFSGLTVFVSLSALMLVPSPAFRSMALGIMLSVAFVLAATLTLLPAVLAKLGPRVDSLSLRWVHSGEHRSPRFARWGERLWRHPHGQTEWCPASRRVRQRLTELSIDYFTRQVPVDKEERVLLRDRTGTETIPVLVVRGEAPLIGEDAILAYLESHEPVPAEARAYRLKAEKARRRYLEEECVCPPQPITR